MSVPPGVRWTLSAHLGQGSAISALRVRPAAADPWNLIRFVPAKGVGHILMASMDQRVVIIADGDLATARLGVLIDRGGRRGVPAWVVAADGAAEKALAAGLRPDVVVGDGDSLRPEVRSRLLAMGVEMRTAARDKDESDTELCLLAALEREPDAISIVGALGGARPEHAIANVLLLADPRFDGRAIEILDRAARLTRIGSSRGPGELTLTGEPGDYISLFPLGGPVEGVRSSGLRFALHGERLEVGPTRGLSNELVAASATLTTETGCLLVVHTSRDVERGRRSPVETTGG